MGWCEDLLHSVLGRVEVVEVRLSMEYHTWCKVDTQGMLLSSTCPNLFALFQPQLLWWGQFLYTMAHLQHRHLLLSAFGLSPKPTNLGELIPQGQPPPKGGWK